MDASESRRQKTIEVLQKESFDMLIPIHCTGMYSIVQLKMVFGERCKILSTGEVFERAEK